MAELSAVNRTAVGVAAIRARESLRPDRLFDDPFAAVLSEGFVRPPATDGAAAGQRRRLRDHVVLRTRWYDGWLLETGLAQVVLVGAGLDARAWRLPWPAGTVVYELDQAPVLAYKAERLEAPTRCTRRPVAVDLREDWPRSLAAAGFDAGAPSAWLVEGLLVYLEVEEARQLLATVTGLSAPGSALSCEPGDALRRLPGTVSALWRGGLPDGAAAALTGLGWTVREAAADDLAVRWGRPELATTGSRFVAASR